MLLALGVGCLGLFGFQGPKSRGFDSLRVEGLVVRGFRYTYSLHSG